MAGSRLRHRWAVLIAAMLLVSGCSILSVRSLDRSMPILYYRLEGPATLVVGTLGGAGSWTRVTGVSEDAHAVTITVGSLDVPFLPRADEGPFTELTVPLGSPLDDRNVVDGSSQEQVPHRTCEPLTATCG